MSLLLRAVFLSARISAPISAFMYPPSEVGCGWARSILGGAALPPYCALAASVSVGRTGVVAGAGGVGLLGQLRDLGSVGLFQRAARRALLRAHRPGRTGGLVLVGGGAGAWVASSSSISGARREAAGLW